MQVQDLIFVLKWELVIFLIGFLFIPLAFRIFSAFFDRGYIFSKVLGIGILSYIIFVVGTTHLLPFSRIVSIAILILVGVFLWTRITYKNRILSIEKGQDVFVFLKKNYKIIFFEEALFFLGLLFWSYIRAHSPDIHDLEKFMDFGFVNSILRSEYFPPLDIWFPPLPINYYYFGHLMTAVLTKISAIPSNITFNLMIATLFSLTFVCSFSIGATLIQKLFPKPHSRIKLVAGGLLTSFIVSFSGNLQTIYSFFKSYDVENVVPFWRLPFSLESFPNAYWYPNATRFIYHTIHEFPIYSFVVSDLHGHVLSIPLVLTIIAFLINSFFEKRITIPRVIFLSFLLSLSYMTNAWDSIIYFGLSLFIIFYLVKKIGRENLLGAITKTAGLAFVGIVFFILFSFPFNQHFSPFAENIGIVCPPQFLIDAGSLGPFTFEENACQKSPVWQVFILFGFFIFWIIAFSFYLFRTKKVRTEDAIILIFIIFSALLVIAPEIFYLRDIYTGHFRANTMFKLFYQAFIILGITSSFILVRVLSDLKILSKKLPLRFSFIVVSSLLFFLIGIYPYFAINSGYDLKKYKSLDGTSYLKELYPSDYKAIVWINENIKGQPIILEAQGDSYTDYARVSSNTGLPTVLGWTVHEWLWRGSYSIPEPRIKDVKTIYETGDLMQTKNLIEKYKISYIFVGDLEREKYKISAEKFEKLGEQIFSSGDTVVYRTF